MYYVAYGSNLNLNQMRFRCPNSKIVGKGYVQNYRLVFNVHADIIPCEKQETPVLLWEIADKDWASLDRYEGFPKYYIKEIVQVQTKNGAVEGVAYVMASNRKGYALPYDNYFNTILEGYQQNHMNKRFLYEAVILTEQKERECMNE